MDILIQEASVGLPEDTKTVLNVLNDEMLLFSSVQKVRFKLLVNNHKLEQGKGNVTLCILYSPIQLAS